ncbi:hypothetical protein BCV70DRAFT_66435 [Testicularia cyperi]|uniref:Uncharacterized protein n=1 Tax=Testicularia cyperi TaxID=1882483 RepID=A0A317XGL4_9BASI|nr:hypothetical protein BCV70DRAFT_66435 [Testicularia cyperi]
MQRRLPWQTPMVAGCLAGHKERASERGSGRRREREREREGGGNGWLLTRVGYSTSNWEGDKVHGEGGGGGSYGERGVLRRGGEACRLTGLNPSTTRKAG